MNRTLNLRDLAMNRLFSFLRNPRRRDHRSTARSLRVESLEQRQMMAVDPFGGIGRIDNPLVKPAPTAAGSIVLNASTGTVTIEGSDAYNDTANIYINRRGGGYS